MAKKYKIKVVVSGNIIEVYKYSEWQFYDFTTFPKREIISKKEDKRGSFSKTRSRFYIRSLVNSNPELERFLTLTYRKNEQNIKKSNYNFTKFIERLKYKYGKFKYICIVEFQDDVDFYGRIKEEGGSIHYHLIWSLPFINKDVIAKIWGLGFIKLKRVRTVRNLGAYFSKYGTKENNENEKIKLFGQKKYFASRDLNRPLILRNPENTEEYIKNNLKDKTPFYEKVYLGYDLMITYQQFKTKVK